jgi:hypothetical protein
VAVFLSAPVKTDQILLEWDPCAFSILAEVSGAAANHCGAAGAREGLSFELRST